MSDSCVTPETAAHQAPLSLGFSRQEHWSGLPFPSPIHESEKWKVKVKSLSRVRLFATPWTVAYQAPPPMGFSRQEYWSGLPLPSPPHLSRKPYTESASFLCGIHSLSFLETEIQCNSRWHVVSQRTMIFCLFCRRWKQKLLDGTSGKDFYPSILPALFGVWIWWLELQEP